MDSSIVDDLINLELNPRGALVRAAKKGIITSLECSIPGCSRPREFDPTSAHPTDWSPTADHFPKLKMMGGTLALNNVRLAHKLCNREDAQSRALAQNLINLLGVGEAGKVLKSLESPGESQSLTIERPLEGDQPARLRLIEALWVELGPGVLDRAPAREGGDDDE